MNEGFISYTEIKRFTQRLHCSATYCMTDTGFSLPSNDAIEKVGITSKNARFVPTFLWLTS